MSTLSQNTATDILVRHMDFEFDDSIPKYWFGNDPVSTMLMSALSAVFPEGEMGFVRSVRHYQSKINDPKLRAEVRAFIGQEAHHGKEHRGLNELMDRKGLPIEKISEAVRRNTLLQEKNFSPARMLANTCALEHFTALFAERLLEDPSFLDGMDERLKPLWLWHAIEESEHKSVAFDVYQNQVNNYWVRTSQMALITFFFSLFTTLHTIELLTADKQLTNLKSMRSGAQKLLGKNGFLRGMLPKYLAYYKPSFHPSKHHADHLRQRGIEMLRHYIGEKAMGNDAKLAS